MEEQRAIIAALCAGATNDTVRNCLRKYDPVKTAYQIEKELKKDRKEVLVNSLEYLGVPGMNQYKAEALPHEIVCKIQNLLPDMCHLCKQTFCVKMGEKPIISCVRCGQGCHNSCVLQLLGKAEGELNPSNNFGADFINPYSTLGLFYLCDYCQKDVIPQKEQLMVRQSSRRVSTSESPPQILSSQPSPADVASTGDDSAIENPPQNHDSVEPVRRGENRVAPEVNVARGNSNQRPNSRGEIPPPVCKHYKTGRCKHGVSGKKDGVCPYSHPKPCSKFLTNGSRRRGGCTKGENCRLYHPSMCHSSVRERKCLRENCKFMHVRGTQRTETNPPEARYGQNLPHITRGDGNSQYQNESTQQPNHSTNHPRTYSEQRPFLEHLKAIQDQMSQMSLKLQQLDTNYGNWCLQQQGYPWTPKYPLMQSTQLKPLAREPPIGQQMAYPNQAMGNSLGLLTLN